MTLTKITPTIETKDICTQVCQFKIRLCTVI